MAWKKGPLPAGTYNWGGVVPVGSSGSGGFYFADFQGDKVVINPNTPEEKTLKADEVEWYDNSLELAPTGKGRASG
jgi:hypothetical protein